MLACAQHGERELEGGFSRRTTEDSTYSAQASARAHSNSPHAAAASRRFLGPASSGLRSAGAGLCHGWSIDINSTWDCCNTVVTVGLSMCNQAGTQHVRPVTDACLASRSQNQQEGAGPASLVQANTAARCRCSWRCCDAGEPRGAESAAAAASRSFAAQYAGLERGAAPALDVRTSTQVGAPAPPLCVPLITARSPSPCLFVPLVTARTQAHAW